MPIKPFKKKPSAEAKRKAEKESDNGPNAETMIKSGFGPAKKTKLVGGFAYQWFDAKREVVRIDFAAESSDGGWATMSFGPIHSAEAQMKLMMKLIKNNGDKLLSLATSTDNKTVSVKEHAKTKTEKVTKSSDDDLEKLFDNPLLRRKKKAK